MQRLGAWIAIISVGALLLPATAGAQGGSLSGLVEDSTGGILPGVTVEADSPVNIEGTLTAFTDGSGRYTVINLRPGNYTVTFTLPGFNTFIREGIVLIGDAAVQVNASMAVGALEETVTVSGESPIVDVQQVRRQFVATRQMMDVLPAARTFSARALLIPGVRNAGMGEGQYWPAVHGSTARDAQTMNDGMRANSTVDDGQFQMGWEMNDAATAELTYEAGGAPAEAQVGGVIQNAIPKEGGNSFSGTWFTYYGAEAFASDNRKDPALRELLGEPNRLAYDIDTNPAFGGPVHSRPALVLHVFPWLGQKDVGERHLLRRARRRVPPESGQLLLYAVERPLRRAGVAGLPADLRHDRACPADEPDQRPAQVAPRVRALEPAASAVGHEQLPPAGVGGSDRAADRLPRAVALDVVAVEPPAGRGWLLAAVQQVAARAARLEQGQLLDLRPGYRHVGWGLLDHRLAAGAEPVRQGVAVVRDRVAQSESGRRASLGHDRP